MIPTYRYSVSSSPIHFDLNEDHNHQLFNTNHQAASSSSSLSYSVFFKPDQDQRGSYCYWETKHIQNDEEAKKLIPSSGSWDHPGVEKDENNSDLRLKVWKKEDGNENLGQAEDSSVKWMTSKMKMMVVQTGSDIAGISEHKFEKQKLPLSPLGTDNSSSNNNSSNHSNITVRVCADCHTTKTPLWRSGPLGPKSLCNACGIRQRKARRALAAAAWANGTILVEAEKPQVKGNKSQRKRKRSKTSECEPPQLKKKRKSGGKPTCRGRNFEDLTMSLSKNLALQQVFPPDEKEAAILLMALSYGLLRGFPSDCYLDL